MQIWHIHPDYATGEASKVFQTLEKVFALQGEQITRGKLGATSRITIGGKFYYVKLYRQAGKKIRRWVGRSRLRGEWENQQHFTVWGIPSAPLVAFGMEKRPGIFKRGAIITAGVENTLDLAKMAFNHAPLLKNRNWVSTVSHQLAGYTRTFHSRRFAHGDLNWRNILATQDETLRVYLIDCPVGRFWLWPFLQHRKNKDLACLDKTARTVLSRTQRLRFFLDYLGKRRLNRRDKKQIRQILGFFRKK